jgi:hypothetical protein
MARITGSSPTPNDRPWAADYPSRNGGSAEGASRGWSRLLVLAYITAISIPPLGLALAIVVAVRPGGRGRSHAVWIALLSVVTAVVWVLILTSGAFNTTSTDF